VSVLGLSVTNNLGSGNSYEWSQLNQGETQQIQFTVTTPSSAAVGDKYNVTVGAQSYNSAPGPFGARSPLDHPEDHDHKSFILSVVPVPPPTTTNVGTFSSGGLDLGTAAIIILAVIVLAAIGIWAWSSYSNR
jgi:hypothetical protein